SPGSPSPPISAASPSTCSVVRPVTATRMPASASSRAIDAPIPRPPPVTSATPSSASAGTRDLLERLRVLERRQVSRILAERPCADRATHDLCAPGLRESGDEDHAVGGERLAELVRDGAGNVSLARFGPRCQHAVEPCDLALHVVRHSDGCGLH